MYPENFVFFPPAVFYEVSREGRFAIRLCFSSKEVGQVGEWMDAPEMGIVLFFLLSL
jgi:hypothetical protein